MSPEFANILNESPFLFKNKNITTNFIQFCLKESNINELFFLAGMKDFHENPTPQRAMFLFDGFCTFSTGDTDGASTEYSLLNTSRKNVQSTKNNIDTAINDYHFANKFTLNIKNVKQIPKIPASLHSCFDILLKDVNLTLIAGYQNLFSKNGIYHNYANKSIFSLSNKSNTLLVYKFTNKDISDFLKQFKFMFGTMLKLEMKTMFSVAKEVENMK